jgi:uridine phosphorylase
VTRPIHLHPTAEPTDRVLLPGDPGRALMLAQALLAEPRMFNHNRGLWGYVGAAADGEPLMVQSTGMGGPSAAIVLEELCDLGVTRAVRVGTCGGLDASLELGDLVVAREALCADGASRALGAGERVAAPGDLAPEGRGGLVVTTDLFYDPDPAREDGWRAAGALAVEMETAALFAVGARRGIAVASVLAVSDLLSDGRRRIDDEGLEAAGERAGRAGAAALL